MLRAASAAFFRTPRDDRAPLGGESEKEEKGGKDNRCSAWTGQRSLQNAGDGVVKKMDGGLRRALLGLMKEIGTQVQGVGNIQPQGFSS